MKNQALFSWKDKIKKLKCHLLQFLFGALRVNDKVKHSEDVDGMANLVVPDQTAPFKEQSDMGLHCLLIPRCPNIHKIYGTGRD